ncbi:MAG TPA: hypothetical protein VGN95_19005 [Pyrinomonadaceae bacterium]|nr:hypothetical protein [Pyrinomonadaceae bacterium]
MNFNFPDKETLAVMLSDVVIPGFPEGLDLVDCLDMALEALKKAIESLGLEEYKPIEEYIWHDTSYYDLRREDIQQLNIPIITVKRVKEGDFDGLPILYIRIFGEDCWRLDATFDPMQAAGSFAGRALAVVQDMKSAGQVITDEWERKFVIAQSAQMLEAAFRKLQGRIEITIESFLDEVFWNWGELWYECAAEDSSLQGFKVKRLPFAKRKEEQRKKHKDDIDALWADDTLEVLSDQKKQLLALYYENTLEHWKEMERMQVGLKDWRRYIRAGDMSDITDDLIADFENGVNISDIAIEHAARRAKLYNVFDVRDKRLEKRRIGIEDSGYSRARLFELKKEGEKLVGIRKTFQSTAE